MSEALELFSSLDELRAARVDGGAEDLHRVTRLVRVIGGDEWAISALKIYGAPWSKSRPRTTRTGQMYQKPEDRAAERALASTFARWQHESFPGNVALAAIFYRPNRQRIDADNLLKHVCDSANGILWEDDSQVTTIAGLIELDPGLPRTVVAVAHHASSLTRGSDWVQLCVRCGAEFTVDRRQTVKRYCSLECSSLARGHVLTAPVPCAQCGEPYKRNTKTQKFCSVACRADSVRGNKKGGAQFSRCTTCDKELTHKRGGQCRRCWALRGTPLRSEVTS